MSGANVAFTSDRLSQLTEEKLFEVLGTPESVELIRRDGKLLDHGVPGQLVKATGWDNWIDEDDEDIRVLDLGEAFLKGAEPEKLPQPSHLRAPETIFMDSCDSRHDLWRAGIMVRTASLKFWRKVLTSVWADIHIPVWISSISILVQRRSGCTNDSFCGGFTNGMAAKMGRYATEVRTELLAS